MVLSLFRSDKIYQPYQMIDEYSVIEKIAEGRYGICYKVSCNGQQYLIKQLKKGILKKSGSKVSFEEKILCKLQHPCIPRFIKKIDYPDFFGYVLEYLQGKTLDEIIYSDNYRFKESEIYQITAQLLEIISFLHSQDIVHRDIRMPNILYDGIQVSLIDFGLSRFINNQKYKADIDFAFLGDCLLHLYYSDFDIKRKKNYPWYKELPLSPMKERFLKKLLGIEERFVSIIDVQNAFLEAFHA